MNMSKKLITHSGPFHTDDVFATALLLHFFPDAEVVRTRDEAVIATGDIVYDVGKRYEPVEHQFDHHQAGASRRPNDIIYCSFGLLWKEYGVEYCAGNHEAAALIEQKLVIPIDANDNGQIITKAVYEDVQPFTIDDIVRIYNPLEWLNASEEFDTQFHEAVRIAQLILGRLRDYAQDGIMAEKFFVDTYAKATDKRIVMLEKSVSVNNILDQCPELLYVVSPRPEGTWSALAVRVRADAYESRRPFPEAWRSKDPAELASLTGVKDATFCHSSGFLAVASSREGALKLAELAASITT